MQTLLSQNNSSLVELDITSTMQQSLISNVLDWSRGLASTPNFSNICLFVFVIYKKAFIDITLIEFGSNITMWFTTKNNWYARYAHTSKVHKSTENYWHACDKLTSL